MLRKSEIEVNKYDCGKRNQNFVVKFYQQKTIVCYAIINSVNDVQMVQIV